MAQANQKHDARYDKIDLPKVQPVVTRVERDSGRCQCCGRTMPAAVPDRLQAGTPFSTGILALALYLRFVHAASYQRLSPLMLDLHGLCISEGTLDAASHALMRFRQHPGPLTPFRVICSHETSLRVRGRTQLNWAERFPIVCEQEQFQRSSATGQPRLTVSLPDFA